MENNGKGTNIFLGVIGVATLIVAIIGATFAFFGAETTGGTDTLKLSSTKLDLSFEDDGGVNMKTDLIPAETWIAEYAAMNQMSQTEIDAKKVEEPEFAYTGNLQCKDDNGNDVCGVYSFSIANPSSTTTQTLYATLNVVGNEFTDLYFRIYDENDKEVVGATNIPATGAVNLTGLTQTLLPSSKSQGYEGEVPKPSTFEKESGTETRTVVADNTENITDQQIKLSDAKRINENATVGGTVTINTFNKRTYKMVLWIEENWTDQTETNSGKSFAGSLVFTTANDKTGVTGVIHAAQKGTNPDDPTSPGFGAEIDASGGQAANPTE